MIARSCTARGSARETALGELGRCGVDPVDRLLIRKPPNELAHAVLELDGGPEAEQRLGPRTSA